MELLWLMCIAVSVGAWFVSAERHKVFWNSTNTKFLSDEYTEEVRINDYLDIVCPHYQRGEVPSQEAERYVLYMVEWEDYKACRSQSVDQLRWECAHPFAPHAPEKFSEKFQRFTPFTLGKEFRQGESYYYISKPLHHHGQECMRLKVNVLGPKGSEETKMRGGSEGGTGGGGGGGVHVPSNRLPADDPSVNSPEVQKSVGTVGMFSTGLTDLKKMRASQSADSVQFLPFLTTILNNLGWLYYGVLKKDGTLVFVNTIGAALQVLYITAYCHYTKTKRRVSAQTLATGTLLFGAWVYFSMFLTGGERRLAQLGLTCSVFTVSMYLSPLTDLVEIVRSRSVERLSFPLAVATFLTSTSWTLYGLQLQDYYIMVPNTPGIVTSLIRFFLFWKFASANQDAATYKLIQM
ncbi:hypothetical protein SKAU_G00223820 [Synaphobranchus kaupii]|uniref:Ephrin-A1 n=1 Tax=Synaphobranchus kaupii TaxID=118154 RepID=A0A9Q1FBF9_SYNKA|nr:hypothetical protein SKAU_G00223820 [Synaphobranchus kaupii]